MKINGKYLNIIANLSSHTVGSLLLPDVTFPVSSSCNNWKKRKTYEFDTLYISTW